MSGKQSASGITEDTEGKLAGLADCKVRARLIQATNNPCIAPVEYIDGKIDREIESFNHAARVAAARRLPQ